MIVVSKRISGFPGKLFKITPIAGPVRSSILFLLRHGYRLQNFSDVVVISGTAVLITVIGNIINGFIASWLAGYKKRRATNVAFTIMTRGEFSIIIAGLAATAGLNPQLPAFAALYVLMLALISPVLAKNTGYFYNLPGKSV
ncbi:Potassium transporter (fragment) [anaerobic digester metagenome]|uniref:Potassium transporter n=1 Tax=anaerobic digester metagenome TaxID=1263854 RepID=A0A485LUC6_9ZZZZ